MTTTLVLAVVLLLLAVAGLGISRLLTGKSRLRCCGMRPEKRKDKKCGQTRNCPLCEPEEKKKAEDE